VECGDALEERPPSVSVIWPRFRDDIDAILDPFGQAIEMM